jgi:hypothetical protein
MRAMLVASVAGGVISALVNSSWWQGNLGQRFVKAGQQLVNAVKEEGVEVKGGSINGMVLSTLSSIILLILKEQGWVVG